MSPAVPSSQSAITASGAKAIQLTQLRRILGFEQMCRDPKVLAGLQGEPTDEFW